MYDEADYCDDDNYNYDTFNQGPPPEPEEYYCDNDDNVAEYFLERDRQPTDAVLCRDCVNAMGVEDEVQPLHISNE